MHDTKQRPPHVGTIGSTIRVGDGIAINCGNGLFGRSPEKREATMAVRTATATRGSQAQKGCAAQHFPAIAPKATRMPLDPEPVFPSPGKSEPAGLDVMLGPVDGSSFQRVDVSVTPAPGGGLQIAIGVPGQLGPAVASLLAALGVKCR